MSLDNQMCAATPRQSLEDQILNENEPKNEREWWACRHIKYLRDEVIAERNADIEQLRRRVAELTAERDAALTRCKHIETTIEPYLIDRDRMAGEITTLKSALREAKTALLGVLDNQDRGAEYWSCSGGVYEAVECNNAIKSINAALGEEK